MNEVLAALVWANLATSLAILAVLALRSPARRLFGARFAYGLWLLVPAAFLASFIPPREVESLPPEPPAAAQLSARLAEGLGGPVPVVWLAGAAAVALLFAWSQARFLREAARGRAGPAVVGVFAPRIVVPADHHERYTP
jgi:beta-lactamase regulating signal transducer with metallopeptidase domain